jgi:hypothetical protein
MLPPGASEAALLAELIAAGLDPQLAGIAVSIAQLKRTGPTMFLYGVVLPRSEAAILREKVAALEAQLKKGLVTDLETHKALLALGIPAPDAQALLSLWAAEKVKPSKYAEFLPR